MVASFTACTDKFEEFNTDVKNPAIVEGESLFSNAQRELARQISSTNVNLNIFKLMAQYWTETTYIDEANYDLVNRSIPDNIFEVYYQDILKNFQEATLLIEATVPTSAVGEAVKANKLAIIELLNVYAFQNLVDIFGDVPYTEALDIEKISPKYDDAAIIYADLIVRIDAALGNMDDTEGSFGSADLIYSGDVELWKKFANSLKLKIAITMADANATLAKSAAESAVSGGVFTSNDDNALFPFLSATHTNPLYEDLVQSGRNDFVPANTIVDIMNDLGDPRRPYYFTLFEGNYFGGSYGYNSPYSLYSHIPEAFAAPNFPGILMTYDEVLFYMAEAAERTFSVGSNVGALYGDAIKASILFWGGTEAEANSYVAQPNVNYATAPGTFREKIGTQAWIAFYTRGLEGYTMWRRMDYPIFNIPSLVTTYDDIPIRFPYPVNEQTLNNASYTAASLA
ncbi:MAG: SusD/RagB family nutrient-binding outer membrane lipoprotein, partial [Bacteroidales bacterium]